MARRGDLQTPRSWTTRSNPVDTYLPLRLRKRIIGPRLRRQVAAADACAQRNEWSGVLDEVEALFAYPRTISAKTFRLAATAHRKLGDLDQAQEFADQGQRHFPRDLGLMLEAAKVSADSGNWEAARALLATTLQMHPGSATPTRVAQLTRWSMRANRLDYASATIEHARQRWPEDPAIDTEWAALPQRRDDWNETISRSLLVIAAHGDNTPNDVRLRLSDAYRCLNEDRLAREALETAVTLNPENVNNQIAWAGQAAQDGDRQLALDRWNRLIAVHGADTPPETFLDLADAQIDVQRLDDAARTLAQAATYFPGDEGVASLAAGVAMAREAWSDAIRFWCRYLDEGPERTLPLTSGHSLWPSSAWLAIARTWQPGTVLGPTGGRSNFPLALADLFLGLGQYEVARQILEENQPPNPSRRAWALGRVNIAAARRSDGATDPDALKQALADTGLDTQANAAALGENARVFSELGTPPENRDTFRVRRILVPRDSTLELQIRAGRYFDEVTIRDLVGHLSSVTPWPETTARPNPVERMTLRLSRRFAQRYATEPFLPPKALAAAIYTPLYSELWDHLAMRRVARHISKTAANEPIFVKMKSPVTTYLNGYRETDFRSLTLYAELRRAGANAFLVTFVDPGEPRSTRVEVHPNPTFMQARPVRSSQNQAPSHRAIVPSGIRSVQTVISRNSGTLTYSASSIVPDYAYERTYRSDLRPSATFLPPRTLLPVVNIGLVSVANLVGHQLIDGKPEKFSAAVEESNDLSLDWMEWLHFATKNYFAAMAYACHAEVAGRTIRELDICDHPYIESALMAAAVKKSGGSVILWPHSTNPVHVNAYGPDMVDEIHAITRQGCQSWSAAVPDATVHLTSDLMLQEPTRPIPPSDHDTPLTVIVIGGRVQLASMPFVNTAAHERTYQQLFRGIGRLQATKQLQVLYKPKGTDGEDASWLTNVVGGVATWNVTHDHPTKLNIERAIFVCVSIGSSALLEGLGMGIPGVIVQDVPFREYLAVSEGLIPKLGTEDALSLIADFADANTYDDFRNAQIDRYCHEIGIDAI